MRFWDASAVVALLLAEPGSQTVDGLYRLDDELVVWWTTEIECLSALARPSRSSSPADAFTRLDVLVARWAEIQPDASVRRNAARLVSGGDLRAGDALQLAAALEARGRLGFHLSFVCLDQRLRAAAEREGLDVEPR